MVLPFLAAFLLAWAVVAVTFPLVFAPICLLLLPGELQVSVGYFHLVTFTLGRANVRLGLLPLWSSVKPPPRAAPAEPRSRPLPQSPWVMAWLQASTIAVQVVLAAALAGPGTFGSFARGLWQAFWPWGDQVRPWVHAVAVRAAAGVTPGLVGLLMSKVLALNVAMNLAPKLAAGMRHLLFEDRSRDAAVIGAASWIVILAIVPGWIWQVAGALGGSWLVAR